MYDKEYNSIHCKKYYANHKQQKKDYNLKNKEKIYQWHRNHRSLLKIKVFERLGNQCSNPYHLDHGTFLNDKRCLQIDHVNGNGYEDARTTNRCTCVYYRLLLELPEAELKTKYQLLCANCNWIKRVEKHEVRRVRFT